MASYSKEQANRVKAKAAERAAGADEGKIALDGAPTDRPQRTAYISQREMAAQDDVAARVAANPPRDKPDLPRRDPQEDVRRLNAERAAAERAYVRAIRQRGERRT